MDAHLGAYSQVDGAVLRGYDTMRAVRHENGVKANGGSIDSAGPTSAGGMLFVNSCCGL